MTTGRPGLYLHVPFCSAICPYCDFAVRKGRRDQAAPFVDSLLHELRGLHSGELLPEALDLAEAISDLLAEPFDTVYLGGGTPSFLGVRELGRLFDALSAELSLSKDCRIFFEANPEDVDAESVAGWRELGVSTLSLGVQSLDDDELRFLGRRHSARDAHAAVDAARGAGFDTVSVDLIYGLPDQTPERWTERLQQVLALGVDHLSLYELEIHARTAFGKRQARGERLELPEDAQAELFLRTHEILDRAGWDAYEVSNFARTPEHRSRHNQKYWHHVPYLGLGPSAHSFVDGWRFWNEPLDPRRRKLLAQNTSPAVGWEKLPSKALALERLMLGLRTREGVALAPLQALLEKNFLALNEALLQSWEEQGLLRVDDTHLVPTPRGRAVADRLASELELE